MLYTRIKDLRINNNLTQKDISKILEISEISYSNYESGKKIVPISLLIKLAKYYNTSIDYIVGDTDEIIPNRSKES